ncbi:VOC family protein [Telmatocola sphagniphila]|uniref:VOC family protein n=1 Tax=Telmatocola sphagniphila TaxID=1123043 RepID=A0A8E6B8N8_9BACT|nr:ArsI/CadI family heavy metal resistance metalloenzyme [Telmatocola sphagniphila]QVL34170.1 VOC family protein [Telmatocola sphagniphila]
MTTTLVSEPSEAIAAATKFQFGLYVTDLRRSVRFYTALLGVEASKSFADYSQFELSDPPIVLSLKASTPQKGSSLNHVGLRLKNSEAIVEVQRRLEAAGYATRREDGVECCYSRQTKFWATDPDGVLWETYTLHEDIDHHGGGSQTAVTSLHMIDDTGPILNIWVHTLAEKYPTQLEFEDNSLDEVRLEGSFNSVSAAEHFERLLSSVYRKMKPGARMMMRGMVSDLPFPGVPDFPGLAAPVKNVPVEKAPIVSLLQAGFRGVYIDRLKEIDCLKAPGVELKSIIIYANKPLETVTGTRQVRYNGPFRKIVDDDGIEFPIGEFIELPSSVVDRLTNSPETARFTIR